jgi:hypothetical protein
MIMTDTSPTDEPRPARGRPFAPGNPGRRFGSKNKASLIAASLLADETEELLRIAIDIAKAGDKDMLKFLLGRVLPKERAIRLDLPLMDFASDAVDALAAVTDAVSAGELTPSEGAALGSLIGSCSRTINTLELEVKIESLEAKLKSE